MTIYGKLFSREKPQATQEEPPRRNLLQRTSVYQELHRGGSDKRIYSQKAENEFQLNQQSLSHVPLLKDTKQRQETERRSSVNQTSTAHPTATAGCSCWHCAVCPQLRDGEIRGFEETVIQAASKAKAKNKPSALPTAVHKPLKLKMKSSNPGKKSKKRPGPPKLLRKGSAEIYARLIEEAMEEKKVQTNPLALSEAQSLYEMSEEGAVRTGFNTALGDFQSNFGTTALAGMGSTHPSGCADGIGMLLPAYQGKQRTSFYPSSYSTQAINARDDWATIGAGRSSTPGKFTCPGTHHYISHEADKKDLTIEHVQSVVDHWNKVGRYTDRATRSAWYNNSSNHTYMCRQCNSSLGGGAQYNNKVGDYFTN